MASDPPVTRVPRRVAVVGAGLAGATCACRLRDAGLQVTVFEKSRGVGGRMATRRVTWSPDGRTGRVLKFDHGTPAFGGRSPSFLDFVDSELRAGRMARWTAEPAPGSYRPLDAPPQWVAQPDNPSPVRALLQQVPVRLNTPVTALAHHEDGWRVMCDVGGVFTGFDAVLLAMPPAQAAALLQPHRPDWAHAAAYWPTQPTWTLFGLTGPVDTPALARPLDGPLAWVLRDDLRPGREREPDGSARWVLHATPSWSATHLEASPGEVTSALQAAFAQVLGRAVEWRFAAVHRWRYASVPRGEAQVPGHCWWQPEPGLGVCGDFLGGAGVEGAWSSGLALAERLLQAPSRGSEDARGATGEDCG